MAVCESSGASAGAARIAFEVDAAAADPSATLAWQLRSLPGTVPLDRLSWRRGGGDWFFKHFDHAARTTASYLLGDSPLLRGRILDVGCGDGITDLGIALRWETERRPTHLRHPPLAEGQAAKLAESYDVIERQNGLDGPIHLGHIALATALAWLEFRALPDFRAGRPKLALWYEAFSARPSRKATDYSGETQDAPSAAAIAG